MTAAPTATTRYPTYKPSGQPWLGDVPEHWGVKRTEHVADSEKVPVTVAEMEPHSVLHYSIPSIQETGLPIEEPGEEISSGKILVRGGEILVSKLNPRKATITTVEAAHPFMVASSEFVPLVAHSIDHRYLQWTYQSEDVRRHLSSMVESATKSHQRVNPTDITKLQIPLPPLHEQLSIARYLDAKTAQIDQFIRAKERLIDLLQEQCTALIHRAVTRGLDPDAKLKPSGVKWLGDVPEGWEVVKLGHRYDIQLGRMLNKDRIEGPDLKPYLRVGDVQWGMINTADLPMMDFPPEVQESYLLRTGDLLVNEGGSYVGRTAVWKGQLEECYFQKALHRVRPLDTQADNSDFLLYVMEYATNFGVFVAGGNQTTIDHLTKEQFQSYRFAFPTRGEQTAIVDYLATTTSQMDYAKRYITRSIRRLKALRTALISEVVTGKRDVRNHPLSQEGAARERSSSNAPR